MGRARFVKNPEAIGKVLNMDELQSRLNDLAERGAQAGGEGYVARESRTDRARAAVVTATVEAIRDNAENHTLLGVVVNAMRQ